MKGGPGVVGIGGEHRAVKILRALALARRIRRVRALQQGLPHRRKTYPQENQERKDGPHPAECRTVRTRRHSRTSCTVLSTVPRTPEVTASADRRKDHIA